MKINLFKNKEKTNKDKEKSHGRSMVEMLGVLAIIGVLSIGGIQGYTIAMRKHKANEILNVASKYAVIMWTYAQKKFMDDSENYYWSSPNGCGDSDKYHYIPEGADSEFCGLLYNTSVPSFQDLGLGGLPSGSKGISLHHIVSGNSGVAIEVVVEFDSKALCETISTMIDSAGDIKADCSLSTMVGHKHLSAPSYALVLPFYQK